MSQQLQQYPQQEQSQTTGYQPQYQAQTPMGQQFQSSQIGQQVGQRFQDSVPQEVQQVVMDLDRLETLMEWGKTRAVERGMVRVASRCDDIANIAHLEKKLVLRQSPFAHPIGQATQQTIQQGVQELQHHVSQPEVQEALSHAQQTAQTISQALARLQQFGQQGTEMTSQHGGGQQQGLGQQQGVGQQGIGQPTTQPTTGPQ